jgi:F-type H+-transporting ATPase subunit delta
LKKVWRKWRRYRLENSKKKVEYKSNYLAQALLNLARAENMVDRVEGELRQLKDTIIYNLDLKKYLDDPAIEKSEKIKAFLEILDDKVSDSIKAFSSMIIILESVEYIDEIYKDFVDLVNKLKQQVSIEVVSTINLNKKIITEIKKSVDSKTGLDVRIKNTIDKSIIGGLVIRIGDRVIDLSIKNKIKDLKEKLKAVELRGEEFGSNN